MEALRLYSCEFLVLERLSIPECELYVLIIIVQNSKIIRKRELSEYSKIDLPRNHNHPANKRIKRPGDGESVSRQKFLKGTFHHKKKWIRVR